MDTLLYPITDLATAERVHRLARRIMDDNEIDVMNAGLRAVRAKDRGVMHVLERMTEFLQARGESEYGRTIRDGSRINCLPPECTIWRAAYEAADRGTVRDGSLAPMYAAAAVWAGVVHMDGVR